MSISWLITNFIAAFLLPPLNLLLLGGTGLLLLRHKPRLGKGLLAASLAGLRLLSTPIVAGLLLDVLKPPPVIPDGTEADAIVVLGGGAYRDTLEYGGDTIGRLTLERVRYGAWLARRTGKPVLVSGGAPTSTATEGQMMRAVLQGEFDLPVRWVEDRSENTRENALRTAELLERDKVKRIYLVSHAWHLRRAIPEFEHAGLTVIPAGIGYSRATEPHLMDFIPNAKALLDSYLASHELIGLVWYRLRN